MNTVSPVKRRFKLDRVFRMCRKERRGTAVVEFALVAPIFILFVLGMFEWGRMVMVQQIITNASREGARLAVLDGVATGDVQTNVQTYLSDSGITIPMSSVTVVSTPPVAPDYADSMTVTVTVPFSDVSWLPSPMSLTQWLPSAIDLSTLDLEAATTMRRETVQ